MSWIQENKFTATLAGITAVGSAALLYLAMQQSGEEDVINRNAKKMSKEEVSLREGKPFPSQDNLDAKEENIADYAEAASKLQNLMVKYRPEQIEDFEPAQFGPMLSKYRTDLNQTFEAAETTLPERTFYGFNDYANRLPKGGATGELKYEMDAMKWLFESLAEVQPEKLLNVYRQPLDVEAGSVSDESDSKRGGRNEPTVVYRKQPIEISFLASEKSLMNFLEAIANSDRYFFAVRCVRFKNENQAAPSKSSAKFNISPATPAGDNLFDFTEGEDAGGFLIEPEETADSDAGETTDSPVVEAAPAPATETGGEKVLKQILGKEKIYVSVRLELIIFEPKEKVELPRVDVAAAGEGENDETETK